MSNKSTSFKEKITELETLDSVDTGNDLVLIYDASTKKLKKVAASNFTVGDGDGNQSVAGNLDVAGSYKQDGVTLSNLIWVDVTVAASDLDSAGKKTVMAANKGQYKIRDVILVGGGTNFGGGGNRLIDLTDGTTVYTQIANADIESAPSASLRWGNTKVPMLTGTSDTATVADAEIKFVYSGGTTDHSTGSIKFAVCLEKIA